MQLKWESPLMINPSQGKYFTVSNLRVSSFKQTNRNCHNFSPFLLHSASGEAGEILRQFTDQTLTGQLTILKTEGLISLMGKTWHRHMPQSNQK